MALYTIETPKGELMEDTLSETSAEAMDIFDVYYTTEAISGLAYDRGISFDAAAKKLGYKAVRVYLTKEKPVKK